jgi:hypothetical protein
MPSGRIPYYHDRYVTLYHQRLGYSTPDPRFVEAIRRWTE